MCFSQDPQLRANVLTNRPVNGDVLPNSRRRFVRDRPKYLVGKHLDRGVVGIHASHTGLPHVSGTGDWFFDRLGRRNRQVLLLGHRLLQQLGE
jgi:hypothetical protein